MNGDLIPRNVTLWRDSSDRLTCSCGGIEAAAYATVCRTLSKSFGLEPEGELIDGFDVMFQDYVHGRNLIGLEWDVWKGFMAVAKSADTEPLIQAIAEWLSRNQVESPKSSS